MLKKSITYETFDRDTVTEDFYFHLSKADLVELEASHKGGLQAYIQRVIDAEDGAAIIEEFKKLVAMSVGKKSPDGRRFLKTEEIRQDFMSSPAYDVFFMELLTDAGKAAEFVNGIVPSNLERELEAIPKPAAQEDGQDAEEVHNVFEEHKTRVLTRAEMLDMDSDELKSGLATGRYQLPANDLS